MYTAADNEPLTPAESTRHGWMMEENALARQHDIKTREMELAVLKEQHRWGYLLNIPVTIIKLPLYLILGLGFIVAMARGVEPSESFWDLLK